MYERCLSNLLRQGARSKMKRKGLGYWKTSAMYKRTYFRGDHKSVMATFYDRPLMFQVPMSNVRESKLGKFKAPFGF